MAVTLDATSSAAVDAASITTSHTCSGSNRLLVVIITIDGTETVSGTPTYAGVNMTQLLNIAPGNFRVYMYYLVAPSTGANNISISFSGGQDAGMMAVSYNGVDQGTPPTDGTAAGGDDNASPYGRSITTSSANSLVVMGGADNDNTANARTPLAGTAERHDRLQGSGAGDYGGYMADILDAGAAGSKTITYTDASVSASTLVIAAFKAAVTETINPDKWLGQQPALIYDEKGVVAY